MQKVEDANKELQSKLDKSQELCRKNTDEKGALLMEIVDLKRRISCWKSTHDALMNKDPQTLNDYNLQAVEGKTRKRRQMDDTVAEIARLQGMVKEFEEEVGDLQDKLDAETNYAAQVKEAFYTVRLEFEERVGDSAHTLLPKKGGGYEPARVNDLWG